MNVCKFMFVLFLGVFIAASFTIMTPQVVYAQCGLPGQPPCPPSGGGEGGRKKKPTPLPPKITATPLTVVPDWIQTASAETLTAEPTANPYSVAPKGPVFVPTYATATAFALTYLPCYATIFPPAYQTAAAALTQTSNDWSYWAETTADVAVNRCVIGTPSPPTPVFIPPVAGPTFVPPGVKNVLILVLLIGGLSSGTFLILRGFRPPNPNKPPNPNMSNPAPIGDGSAQADDLNPQPLPPKGITDGSKQFDKTSPLHGSEDIGGDQFMKE